LEVFVIKIKDLLAKGKKEEKKKAVKKLAVGAGIGAAVGVAAGLLFAPKSGKETREQIAKTAKEAAEKVKETAKEVKEKIEEAAAAREGKCCCEETKEEAPTE
jgi:gas vesicle protein